MPCCQTRFVAVDDLAHWHAHGGGQSGYGRERRVVRRSLQLRHVADPQARVEREILLCDLARTAQLADRLRKRTALTCRG